jgi:hypothetical protein
MSALDVTCRRLDVALAEAGRAGRAPWELLARADEIAGKCERGEISSEEAMAKLADIEAQIGGGS